MTIELNTLKSKSNEIKICRRILTVQMTVRLSLRQMKFLLSLNLKS